MKKLGLILDILFPGAHSIAFGYISLKLIYIMATKYSFSIKDSMTYVLLIGILLTATISYVLGKITYERILKVIRKESL